MISQFKLWDKIQYIAGDKPLTDRFQFGHTEIPVIHTTMVPERGPSALIVLAWRYTTPIIARIREVLGPEVPLAVPFPNATELTT